jgi:hypothetical protein
MLKKTSILFSIVIMAVFSLAFATRIIMAEAARFRPTTAYTPVAEDGTVMSLACCCNLNGASPACSGIGGCESCDGIAGEGSSICASSVGITSGRWAGKCIFGMH